MLGVSVTLFFLMNQQPKLRTLTPSDTVLTTSIQKPTSISLKQDITILKSVVSQPSMTFSYLDPDSINGLNLYAYCLNNPLKYIDHFGCSVTLTILAIIGISALIGAAFGALGGVMSGAIKPASIVAKELGRTFEKQLIKILQYQVIKKIVPSLFENLLSDFTSWYTEFVVDNTFQRVFE